MYAIPQAVPAARSPRPARKTNESRKQLRSLHSSQYNRVLISAAGIWALTALERPCVGLKGMFDLAVHIDINICSSLSTAHTCFYYIPSAVTSFCLSAMTELFLTNDYKYDFSVEKKTKKINVRFNKTRLNIII